MAVTTYLRAIFVSGEHSALESHILIPIHMRHLRESAGASPRMDEMRKGET